jgi:polar amino acid transport system ATP-binding protein
MIVLEALDKWRGDRHVLCRVTLTVRPLECLWLSGPSGGGKSTLLRCLNGLEPFHGGSATVAGLALPAGERTAAHEGPMLAVRRKVGMVFQHFGLFTHRTAIANVMEAPMFVRGDSQAEAEAQALALLERLGVAHRRDALPEALSGGEKQRVALARALAMRPVLLLLDEPSSALDDASRDLVVKALADAAAAGTTLVFASHDEEFARALATRNVQLQSGQVVEDRRLATK